MEKIQNDNKSQAFLIGLFGTFLLVGAGYSFITKKWFPGFPSQLDISMLFGGSVGIYVEAAAASVIGISCLYLSIIVRNKHTI